MTNVKYNLQMTNKIEYLLYKATKHFILTTCINRFCTVLFFPLYCGNPFQSTRVRSIIFQSRLII
jgi:hypothetical protein